MRFCRISYLVIKVNMNRDMRLLVGEPEIQKMEKSGRKVAEF